MPRSCIFGAGLQTRCFLIAGERKKLFAGLREQCAAGGLQFCGFDSSQIVLLTVGKERQRRNTPFDAVNIYPAGKLKQRKSEARSDFDQSKNRE